MLHDHKFCGCVDLCVTFYKTVMAMLYLWQIIAFDSHTLKDNLIQLGDQTSDGKNRNSIFTLVSVLWKQLDPLLVQLIRKNSRLVSSPAMHHRLACPYSWEISELFSSASTITLILKAVLFDERRLFGIMIEHNSDKRDTWLILWNVDWNCWWCFVVVW